MDKATAKKLACRYVVAAVGYYDAARFFSEPDRERLESAMGSLVAEMSRRSGEFASVPLDLPEGAIVAMVSGRITIDGNAKTVTIKDLGDTFRDTEEIASILIYLEEDRGFALVFEEVAE